MWNSINPFFLNLPVFWNSGDNLTDWIWHCRIDLSCYVYCAVMSWYLTVFKLFSFFVRCVCLVWLLQCLVAITSSQIIFCFQKKAKQNSFLWNKILLIRILPFLRLPLGFLVIIAFLQPSCGFSVCLFLCLWVLFICTSNFVMHYYFLYSRQFSKVGWRSVLRKKACFLTNMIFCNTSILKYRKENDIF